MPRVLAACKLAESQAVQVRSCQHPACSPSRSAALGTETSSVPTDGRTERRTVCATRWERTAGLRKPALFMTVRGEIAQSPCETGARSREGGREAYLKQYVDRPNGEPACLDAGLPRPGLSQRRIRDCSGSAHEYCWLGRDSAWR